MKNDQATNNWREKWHEIIYEADSRAGKYFDLILIVAIIFSIILVMLESVKELDSKYHQFFDISEWVITILFSIEYVLRIITVKKPKSYIFSFYGIIDFLSTIPKYLSLFIGGAHALVALRALRLLRIFRILKLVRFVGATENLGKALKASRYKIFVFISAVMIICVIIGTLMYLIEGDPSGFTSIPRSIYWAIVTLTTVGYGDIAPQTAIGQLMASLVMILGYGIIAIPTGIVSVEMARGKGEKINMNTNSCESCSADNHKENAKFCYKCGEEL
ncbi:ion transporter [Lutimonas zeaxanthinifaciens]|uniref:ion transporter n=1 Tax=Lutimonas zeaxanthinifaciens TaxID=3060215 RepID=UPI00265D3DD4|nr:ion transporter [Lutimonas sp. YSD2104]WKK67243.1 ion transporter [Lutimonas sp. YSD2104]